MSTDDSENLQMKETLCKSPSSYVLYKKGYIGQGMPLKFNQAKVKK